MREVPLYRGYSRIRTHDLRTRGGFWSVDLNKLRTAKQADCLRTLVLKDTQRADFAVSAIFEDTQRATRRNVSYLRVTPCIASVQGMMIGQEDAVEKAIMQPCDCPEV